MNKLVYLLLLTSNFAFGQGIVERKYVFPVGGNIRISDTCGYSMDCVAGEIASSKELYFGVFSGNIGYLNASDSLPSCLPTIAGVSEITSEENAVNVFPNPNIGSFTLRLVAMEDVVGKIEVTDIVGRKVQTKNINVSIGENNYSFSGFSSGVYFLSCETASMKDNIKVVVY